jgi:hypothetical protein
MNNDYKKNFITVGFPRSGNTYLNYSFRSLYYPNSTPSKNFHSASTINNFNHVFIPFRDPLDSIASWNNYPSNCEIQLDINYYVRFYSEVLQNLDKITLLDFNSFTTDLDYLKNKVKFLFGIDSPYEASDKEIKKCIIEDKKAKNLPSGNYDDLLFIKKKLLSIKDFERCIDLYKNIKKEHSLLFI